MDKLLLRNILRPGGRGANVKRPLASWSSEAAPTLLPPPGDPLRYAGSALELRLWMSTVAEGGDELKKYDGFSARKCGGGAEGEMEMRTVFLRGDAGTSGLSRMDREQGEHGEVASVDTEATFESVDAIELVEDSGEVIASERRVGGSAMAREGGREAAGAGEGLACR